MEWSTALKILAAIAVLASISAFAIMSYQTPAAQLNWHMGEDDPVSKFYPSGDSLFVIGATNISFINSSGQTIWSKPYPGVQYSVAGNNGEIYVYSRNDGLSVLYPDGSSRSIVDMDISKAPVIGGNGEIFLTSWDLLVAMTPDGRELWNASIVISTPVTDHKGNTYFFVRPPEHLSDVYLYSISPDGKQNWAILFDRYYSNTMIKPHKDDGIYVYNDVSGELYQIGSNGAINWKYYKPYLGQFVLLDDEQDRQYLLYLRGTVHILNSQGYLISKFNYETADEVNVTYEPAVYNNTIYILSPDTSPDTVSIYAAGLDGSTLWGRDFNCSGPAKVYASEGAVCVATQNKRSGQTIPVLYVFDHQGKLKHAYSSGDGRLWEQVYINGDRIYAKTYGGVLYALKA